MDEIVTSVIVDVSGAKYIQNFNLQDGHLIRFNCLILNTKQAFLLSFPPDSPTHVNDAIEQKM